jgi:predicted nuclease of predicted toxin-antitoxin system
MKVLLDENLPHDLRHLLPGYDVVTVDFLGLKGLKNGLLLRSAAAQGIEVLITLDTSMPFMQNQRDLPLAIVIVRAISSKVEDLRPVVPAILKALEGIAPGSVVRVP